MSIDHAAVGRLIRYGLEPKLTPARSADYAELVGRARNDSEFAAAAVEIAHGEGLEVLEIDPLLGISLAAMHDSPFTMRQRAYCVRSPLLPMFTALRGVNRFCQISLP